MKMVMAVVPSNTAERVLDALINEGYGATYAETKGGMLRQSQKSLFIAVKAVQLDDVLKLIKDNCRTQVEMNTHKNEDSAVFGKSHITADLGGAVTFVWDIEQIDTF
jgi:uncharacterized protein YaaQ